MKKIRFITCLLTATLIAASFAGCGDTAAKTTGDETSLQQEDAGGQQTPQSERGTMAKVISLDGSQITVVLADMPSGKAGGGTPPAIGTELADGKTPPDGNTPPDGAAPPNSGNGPAPASGTAIDGSGNPGQSGHGGGKITFTGEETTYTLSDDVAITKGVGDSAAKIDLSELAADDVITFTTTADEDGNEVIVAIQVME